MANPAQRSWDWLLPPAVQTQDGGLKPRRDRAAPPAQPPSAPPPSSAPSPSTIPEHSPRIHPEANQQAVLQGQVLHYRLQRSRRRTIGFTIGAQGLVVSAPAWVNMAAIAQALEAKSGWILRKLHQADRNNTLPNPTHQIN